MPEQEEIHRFLDFAVYAQEALGPRGTGVMYIPDFLTEGVCSQVYMDLTGPEVTWLDASTNFTNERGVEVAQNFHSFAVKLLQGDQSVVDIVPGIRPLAARVETVVRGLSRLYPMLDDWTADEAVAQRYTEGESEGLTWHFDLQRHPGLIASISISGRRMLRYRPPTDSEFSGEHIEYELAVGSLTLIRGMGLPDAVDRRPEHYVADPIGDAISLTLRANDRPNDAIKNFKYNNWP